MVSTEKTSFYEIEADIRFCDCDLHQKIKASAICEFMSDLAGVAFGSRGMDHRYLWDRGFVFLLSRVSVRILRSPLPEEKIRIATWEREAVRAEYLRDFEFRSMKGELLIAGTTAWILVDPNTRQILRPSEFTAGEMLPVAGKKADVKPCARLRLKDEDAESVDVRKIYYSHLDGNGHVHNTIYADLAADALPAELIERSLTEFQVNFSREALLGDEIRISRRIEDGEALVKGNVNGKDCFVCRMAFA